MKKLYLLTILIFTAQLLWSKDYPGTVIMNDRTSKTGFISIPDTGKDINLRFSTTQKGKAEKLSRDEVKSFTITMDGQKLEYRTLYLGEFTTIGGFRKTNNKRWCRIIYEGNLSFYSVKFSEYGTTFYNLYVQQPGIDYPSFFDANGGGFHVKVNSYKIMFIGLRRIFKDICPAFVEAMQKDDFKEKVTQEGQGFGLVDEYYTQNCSQ